MTAGLMSAQLAQLVAQLMDDKKAKQVRILDLRNISPVADFFVIGSGSSTVQVRAIADHVEEKVQELAVPKHHTEGYPAGRWVLLDYGDVVVHVFHETERDFYNLERLWGDAPVIEVSSVAAAR